MGVRGASPLILENLCVTFALQSTLLTRGLTVGISAWVCENTVFHLGLVESVDAKPMDLEGKVYLLKKNLPISGPTQFKLMLFKGQLPLGECTFRKKMRGLRIGICMPWLMWLSGLSTGL